MPEAETTTTTTMQIEKDVLDALYDIKAREESYSDVVRRLLKNQKGK